MSNLFQYPNISFYFKIFTCLRILKGKCSIISKLVNKTKIFVKL